MTSDRFFENRHSDPAIISPHHNNHSENSPPAPISILLVPLPHSLHPLASCQSAQYTGLPFGSSAQTHPQYARMAAVRAGSMFFLKPEARQYAVDADVRAMSRERTRSGGEEERNQVNDRIMQGDGYIARYCTFAGFSYLWPTGVFLGSSSDSEPNNITSSLPLFANQGSRDYHLESILSSQLRRSKLSSGSLDSFK